jgi:hypothetical protein
MAFKKISSVYSCGFNSAVSSEFLENYERFLDNKISSEKSELRNKTFSPSSLRCDRQQWFKLRGVEPDVVTSPDRSLSFIADIGTACHRTLQSNLIELLGKDWLEVSDYLSTHDIGREYDLKKSEDSSETLVTFYNPPVRFACDGIVNISGIPYLLEIKTSELSSWQSLSDVKPQHVDQITAYSALLQLPNVLVVYQERQYGGLKCFELKISQSDWKDMFDRFDRVMEHVKTNLAPEGLPIGDKWCTPSYCPYYNKCKEYGR